MRHCIACGHRLPERELFKLNHAPASAQDIPDAEEVKADRGIDLDLYQCPACGLVQFDCEPVSYYRDPRRRIFDDDDRSAPKSVPSFD